jgi:hypothetical protein
MQTSFKCKNGRIVKIMIDEENDFCAAVFDEHDAKLGEMKFRENDGCLKLVWAYLDQKDPAWCCQGIGREIIRNVIQLSGCVIFASDNDGMRLDDGSHLTGDAPAFVAKMRAEGLIRRCFYDSPDFD